MRHEFNILQINCDEFVLWGRKICFYFLIKFPRNRLAPLYSLTLPDVHSLLFHWTFFLFACLTKSSFLLLWQRYSTSARALNALFSVSFFFRQENIRHLPVVHKDPGFPNHGYIWSLLIASTFPLLVSFPCVLVHPTENAWRNTRKPCKESGNEEIYFKRNETSFPLKRIVKQHPFLMTATAVTAGSAVIQL